MTYTIAQISEKFDVAASTLRYYEEIGLLTNVERTDNGRRVYSDAHVGRLSLRKKVPGAAGRSSASKLT